MGGRTSSWSLELRREVSARRTLPKAASTQKSPVVLGAVTHAAQILPLLIYKQCPKAEGSHKCDEVVGLPMLAHYFAQDTLRISKYWLEAAAVSMVRLSFLPSTY